MLFNLKNTIFFVIHQNAILFFQRAKKPGPWLQPFAGARSQPKKHTVPSCNNKNVILFSIQLGPRLMILLNGIKDLVFNLNLKPCHLCLCLYLGSCTTFLILAVRSLRIDYEANKMQKKKNQCKVCQLLLHFAF